MGITRFLSKRLRIHPRRTRESAKADPLLLSKPDPIDLTPPQRAAIETRIREFISDSASIYAYARGAIAREDVLPLLFDWTGFMALTPGGQVAWVHYDDEPGEVETVHDERLRNIGLFQGTKLHPELQFLLPVKPSNAIECHDCRGTGRLSFPRGHRHLSEIVICYCGGIGWLPSTRN
jgi:hypothetical protein